MTRTGKPRLGMVATGTALVSAALLAMPPADAARYRVVTKTFSNPQPIAIPAFGAATPYPSEMNAGGFKRSKILDVNLALKNFDHAWLEDVDVMPPQGMKRTVMSDGRPLPRQRLLVLAHQRRVQADQRLTLRAGCLPRPRARSERDSGTFRVRRLEPQRPLASEGLRRF